MYPSRAMNGDKKFSGPLMLAACFFTFGISTGLPYYNISFFFDYFRDGHGWTQELVTMGAPIAVLLSIWAGPVIVPRVSPRILIIIGTGLTFGAFQWFGRLSGNPYEYYAAWTMYMFGYFLAGPIPHQIIVSNWYKQRRGRAMGIAYVGVAVVGWAGTKIGPWLASQMEYTEALKMMSFILLAAWPIALFIIKDKPEDIGQHPDGIDPTAAIAEQVSASVATKQVRSYSFLMSKPSFWLLTAGSAASIGSIACVNFLMKFVFEEQGFVEQAARDRVWADAAGFYLLSSIGGRLLAGILADKYPRKWVMLATYAIVCVVDSAVVPGDA